MKRSILGLIYFMHAIQRMGIDVNSRLKQIGLKLEELDPTALIHPSLDWDIFAATAYDIHPEQGLWVGQQYTLTGYGPLLMLMLSSPNLEVALSKGEQYHALTHLVGHIQIQRQLEHTIVYYQPEEYPFKNIALLRAQTEISATFKFILEVFQMMRISIPAIQVKLPFEEPRNPEMLQQYRNYYGENVIFGVAQAEFHMAYEEISFEIPTSDVYSFQALDKQCAKELARLQAQPNEPIIVQRVKDYIDLQYHMIPTMAETAIALHMPERTLRHQLQQADTSYKQLREKRIQQKALALLGSRQFSIEQIAEQLGYSESAAFNHAFKRWFGKSPKQYMK